jgi:hypothetical protein
MSEWIQSRDRKERFDTGSQPGLPITFACLGGLIDGGGSTRLNNRIRGGWIKSADVK